MADPSRPQAEPPPGEHFVHAAVFYRSAGDYTDAVATFVQQGLTTGEPALVVVPRANLELLRGTLNGSVDMVAYQDMSVLGRNPSRIIPFIRRFTDAHPGRTRFVNEPFWAGRTPAEVQEATRHEALINAAFAGVPAAILCPYHVTGLGEAVLDGAQLTHPHILERGHLRASPRYTGTAAALAIAGQPFPAPPARAETLIFGPQDLAGLRGLARKHAVIAGLSGDRVEGLALAVNEAAANTICHANSPGTLRIWQDGGSLICEIRDSGHITDPLAGRHLASPYAGRGNGLRVINQVCDLVELRTSRHGTAIRMHMILI
jgi:anti-sigma regulatory factor (Ser/Thr protein kinase)